MKFYRSTWQKLLSTSVFVVLGAAPAVARADTDGYVELQFDAASIGDLLRRQLATNSSFCPQPTQVKGGPGYVDHLDFNTTGTFSRAASPSSTSINGFTTIQAREVLYHQPVTARLKTNACVYTPDCTTTTAQAATLTYALYTNPKSELCLRNYGASGLPVGATAPVVDLCLGFDADYAMQIAGIPGGTLSGSTVSLSQDGTRIATRLELGRTQADYNDARVDAWQDFANGAIEATGAAENWSVFTHKSLILGAIKKRLQDSLGSQPGFQIDGPITTSWSGLGSAGGQISAQLDANLSDTPCPNDIGVSNITLTGYTGINPAHDGLFTSGYVDYDLNDGDVLACGLALGGPLGALILAAVSSSIKVDLPNLGPGCTVDDDYNFSCNERTHPRYVAVGPGQGSTFRLAGGGVVGSSRGLAMNGNITTTGSHQLTMDGQTYTPEFGLAGACFQKSCGYLGGLEVSGTATLCDVSFWASNNGDVNLFEISYPDINSLPAQYNVTLPMGNSDAYAQNPYELMATVMTSAGVRTYGFEPVSLLDPQEENFSCMTGTVNAKVACTLDRAREWPWEKYHWGWYPETTIDRIYESPIMTIDGRGNVLRYGVVRDLQTYVTRGPLRSGDRPGLATSVTIQGQAYTDGARNMFLTEPIAIQVNVPERMSIISGDRELIAEMFPSGYEARIPSELGRWSIALSLSLEQLAVMATLPRAEAPGR